MPLDQIVNTALGLALEDHNDKRQLKQQEKLQNLQIAGSQRLQKYGQELALDTWQKTNYPAQIEQLKKAGLSTGLIYGSGGQGGTVSAGSGATTSGASAPVGGQEILGLQLMGAQRDLLIAQTKKAEAEAAKTAGVDTDLAKENIRIQKNAADFATNAYEVNYSKLLAEADKVAAEAEIAQQTATVGRETIDERIATAEGELIGLGIANELKKTQSDLTKEQITATAEAVKQKWEEIGVAKDRLKLDQFVKDVADSTKLTVEVASKITSEIIEAVGRGKARKTVPRNERGWSEKNGEWYKTVD